jgi:hypothetical protein
VRFTEPDEGDEPARPKHESCNRDYMIHKGVFIRKKKVKKLLSSSMVMKVMKNSLGFGFDNKYQQVINTNTSRKGTTNDLLNPFTLHKLVAPKKKSSNRVVSEVGDNSDLSERSGSVSVKSKDTKSKFKPLLSKGLLKMVQKKIFYAPVELKHYDHWKMNSKERVPVSNDYSAGSEAIQNDT